MSYKDLASKINQKYINVEESLSFVKEISFASNWQGKAKESLIPTLEKILSDFDTVGPLISNFTTALEQLETYKNKKEKIVSLKNQYNSIPNTKDNVKRKNNLSSQINTMISDNRNLRKSIESKLNSITPITPTLDTTMSPILLNSNGTLIVDAHQLLEKFNSGTLKKLGDSDSLYNYFTEAEVDQLLQNIKNNYQGRYLAINSALGIVDLAASKNLKLDYDWGGGHVNVTDVDHVATGTDCSAFVSWAINQGASGTFTTRTTSGLKNVGTTINYQDAQTGDILVYNNGENGHVVMIVENNPETETFIVVEANGSNKGVILQTKKYSSLKNNNYQAKDLSEIYNEGVSN